MRRFTLLTGRAEDLLPSLAGPFDACLCDPPYGLGFMGKAWDRGVPPVAVWALVLALLRPGSPLLAFGGTRTYHRLTCAIEDAGFEIRDSLCWLYGSGFPKSLDVSKAIDKAAGVDGEWRREDHPRRPGLRKRETVGLLGQSDYGAEGNLRHVYQAASGEAVRFAGYGSALKPAWEPIILAMAPLAGTFASNALAHGVAGLNVDGRRIGEGKRVPGSVSHSPKGSTNPESWGYAVQTGREGGHDPTIGRWPANVALDGEAAAMLDEQSGELSSGFMAAGTRRAAQDRPGSHCYGTYGGNATSEGTIADTGGASRFFYTAKADSGERAIGGIRCTHPTLKPVDLCAWLAKLILPPPRADGQPRRLVVPFAGAGSEVIGALRAGWDEVVGIEASDDYAAQARKRIRGDAPLLNVEAADGAA